MNNLPEGLYYYPDMITVQEEQVLVKHLQGLDWQQVALFGQIAKRRVVHFGMDYQYERRAVKPTNSIPLFLNSILKRGATVLNVFPEDIAEVLITEYPVNAGIGWHRDAPVFGLIFGVSLISATPIHFRKRADHKEQIKLILEPRSGYALTQEVRWEWDHRIAPVKSIRYSITFRTLK